MLHPIHFPSAKRSKIALMTVLIIACLLLVGQTGAYAQGKTAPQLFGRIDNPTPSVQSTDASSEIRSRYVTVDQSLLFDANGKPKRKKELPRIALNLFSNAHYTGVVKRVERDLLGVSWTGKLKGVPGGYFSLVVVDNVFMAHIASTQGIYEVHWAGEGLYKIVQIDQSKFIDEPPGAVAQMDAASQSGANQEADIPVFRENVAPEGGLPPDPGAQEPSALGEMTAPEDSSSVIDVMVIYTSAARAGAGSDAAMKAAIALAVLESNTAYYNAGVSPRLRLVHVDTTTYVESGAVTTDLARLQNASDGYMDWVPTFRNMYGADMVALVVNSADACGIASAIGATATNAYVVVQRPGCLTGYYSFAHEYAHLQGARHDTYVDSGSTPYAYGHGYVHTGSTTAARWRTIMAYNNKCGDLGYYCTRLQYFSNPTKTYNSAAMGVSGSSEVYKVLNNTAYNVANFRTAVISTDWTSNFNGSAQGWYNAKGSWSSYNYYLYSYGVANSYASVYAGGKSGDLKYQARMYRSGTCTGCSNALIVRGNPASLDSAGRWKQSYLFQYTNSGFFSVYRVSTGGTITALKGWTSHSAIVKNGWNTLTVVAVYETLRFYINGTLVWTGDAGSYTSYPLVGSVGISYYRDSEAGTMYVDWASLSLTPTADAASTEDVVPGQELSGGSIEQSP